MNSTVPFEGDGSSVRPVLLLASFVALTLVLGAGYASIQAASSDARRRIETPAAIVRGEPLRAEQTSAIPDPALDPNGVALLTHFRVEEMAGQLKLAPLPDGVFAVDYPMLALPNYVGRTSKDGSTLPNEEVFPPALLELDGETIAIAGFMIPIEFDTVDRTLKSFVLSPYPLTCHYGRYPRGDEWIEVDARAMGGVPNLPFRVVRVQGKVALGEVFDDYGYLMHLYAIDATKVEEVR